MTFSQSKHTATAVWILALLAVFLFLRPASSNVLLLTAIAITGVIVIRWLWRRPAETMSESIQNARR